jgi:penicillin-binding protein 1A/penicillin-binding protein 2A
MRIFKKIVKWFLKVGLAVLVLLGGFTYHFWYVVNFHKKLSSNVQAKVLEHQIRPLVFPEIPLIYREAVISTEDQSFSWNPGIDPVGILRSLIVDVGQARYVEGGSTITQQLVDNTLIHREKSLRYKLTQAFYALGIYVTFNKEQTFEMYTNVIYFGHGAFGLYNASKTYFGKGPAQLNAGELTMLAGLPNAPRIYDPFKNLSLARQRQSIVLKNMVEDHLISKQESAQIFDQPIRLKG